MSELKNHFKAPLRLELFNDVATIRDAENFVVCENDEGWYGGVFERMVACVNACAGIPTEFLKEYSCLKVLEERTEAVVAHNDILHRVKFALRNQEPMMILGWHKDAKKPGWINIETGEEFDELPKEDSDD